MPIWPPAAPVMSWLARVLVKPWARWDVTWYMRIVTQGYRAGDGTAQFHPLYPLLASALTWLGLGPLLSLFVVETLAVIALLIVFERLAALEIGTAHAQLATILMISRPIAAILLAPYPEALFLACAVLCLYEARRGRWWLAGLAGALAALTRQQGIFLFLPLAWEFWTSRDYRLSNVMRDWRAALSLGLTPMGLGAWLVYRAVALNDLRPDFSSLSAFIYSVPISQTANHVVPEQAFVWPWVALARAFEQVWTRPDIDLVTNLVLGLGFLVAVGFSWRYLRNSYRIYVVSIVLISFSYYTGPVHPFMGLPRHLFLAFPVFIGLAVRLHNVGLRKPVIASGFLGLLFIILLYVMKSWVP